MSTYAAAAETEPYDGVCSLDAPRETDQLSLQSSSVLNETAKGSSNDTNDSPTCLARTPNSTKVQRRSPRMQIQDLLQQIERLQSEVDGLRVNQLLGDSLEQFLYPSRCRPRWRLVATHEQHATSQANTENVRLKKRLQKNLQLIRRARRLMQTQTASIQVYCYAFCVRMSLAERF